jgi:hypothetical protein
MSVQWRERVSPDVCRATAANPRPGGEEKLLTLHRELLTNTRAGALS